MYDVGAFNTLSEEDNPLVGLRTTFGDKSGYQSEEEIPAHILDSAVADMGDKELRASGMAAALTWIDEGEYTAEFLNGLIAGMVSDSDDEDAPVTDIDDDFYTGLSESTAEALVALGGATEQVASAMDGDEDAAEVLGEYLADRLEESEKSDSDLITGFAVGNSLVLDAAKKVVRNGKVVLKKRRLKKVRLNSKQKAALKKAQRKAHNSAARRARAKAMKIRSQHGL